MKGIAIMTTISPHLPLGLCKDFKPIHADNLGALYHKPSRTGKDFKELPY